MSEHNSPSPERETRQEASAEALRAGTSRGTESELLEIINESLSEEQWSRYKKLLSLRDSYQLTEAQYDELIGFTDRMELLQARRIRAVGDLAKIRGVTFDELAPQLGIGPGPFD